MKHPRNDSAGLKQVLFGSIRLRMWDVLEFIISATVYHIRNVQENVHSFCQAGVIEWGPFSVHFRPKKSKLPDRVISYLIQ